MTPLYGNETRSITVTDLPYALRHVLLQHADKQKLRLITSHLWLTHRTNTASKTMLGRLLGRRANNADPDASHDVVLVVHETHLFVATSGAKRGTSVHSLPLLSATLTRGSEGLSIAGFLVQAGSAETYFMDLGGGSAADDCVLAAMSAVDGAKTAPPAA